jgi:transcriptional regulator with XRE-family HTH domain
MRMQDTPGFKKIRVRIGRTLSQARKRSGKDVKQCALAVSVVPNTWHRWESADAMIPADRLHAIAKVVASSVEQLLTGKTGAHVRRQNGTVHPTAGATTRWSKTEPEMEGMPR